MVPCNSSTIPSVKKKSSSLANTMTKSMAPLLRLSLDIDSILTMLSHRIRVTFSISDLTNDSLQDEYRQDEDRALYDDEAEPQHMDTQSGGANTKGAVNAGRTSGGNIRVEPEDRVAPADRPELDDEAHFDEEAAPAFPSRVNVRVTRDGKQGAVMIEATAQDGEILIENVYYFADAAQADPESVDSEWKRRAVYAGPPFGNLDDELQVLLERYLEERGVDVRMANFIPEYIDFKEQKEYLRWLQSKFSNVRMWLLKSG
jgi:complement component 1 Q subcomponent-binding protein